MSTVIPPTPAANKSAEQHQEPSEQDSFNHLLSKVLSLTSEQVQDLNDWMGHRGILNVHVVIAQNFRKPHALEDNLKFITQGKTCYIQSNVMISLSLMMLKIPVHYSSRSPALRGSSTLEGCPILFSQDHLFTCIFHSL